MYIYTGHQLDKYCIRTVEIDKYGNSTEKDENIDNLLEELREDEKLNREKLSNNNKLKKCAARMPVHDLRIFFRHITHSQVNLGHDSDHIKVYGGPKYPAILPRPSAGCFLLELEHIKLICTTSRCIILHPKQTSESDNGRQVDNAGASMALESSVDNFVTDLKRHLVHEHGLHKQTDPLQTCITPVYKDDEPYFPEAAPIASTRPPHFSFELTVLETAFSTVIDKLRKYQADMKPILDLLIHESLSASPPTEAMLRKTLAFKQSMTKFDHDLSAIKVVIQNVLSNDQDMADLTNLEQAGQADVSDHEEVELLLEAFEADLNYISIELNKMKADVDDMENFVNIHLSSTRNRIIQLTLFLDMATVSIGIGAVFAGICGMNLKNGFEDNDTAFFTAAGIIILVVVALSFLFLGHYKLLYSDTREAQKQHFHVLKNFLEVIDEVEARLKAERVKDDGNMTKQQLKKVLASIVNAQADEIDLIFKSIYKKLRCT